MLFCAFFECLGSFFHCEFRPSPNGLPITTFSSKGVNHGLLFDPFRDHLGLQNRSGGQRESICDWATFDTFWTIFASNVASKTHVENDFEFKLFFMPLLTSKSLILVRRVIENALFVSARNPIKKL